MRKLFGEAIQAANRKAFNMTIANEVVEGWSSFQLRP